MAQKFLPKVFAKLRLVIFWVSFRVKEASPEKEREKRQGEKKDREPLPDGRLPYQKRETEPKGS
jgi:hypothetical protein